VVPVGALAVSSAMGTARAGMAAAITAAGEPATLNPVGNPPMILVDAGTWESASGVGAWDVSIPVRCIVPPPGDADALGALEAMVEHVLSALGWAVAEPASWAPSPATPHPMPCYTLTYRRQIPNPDC